MTKRQKKQCYVIGCHKKAVWDLQCLPKPEQNKYMCEEHIMFYIGFMAKFLFKSKNQKIRELLSEGIGLQA